MTDNTVYYTYLHRRKDDGLPFLIGKGKRYRAWERKNRNNWWHNVVDKHDYVVEILQENITEQEALQLEIEMIAHGRSVGWPLVNITNGGDGVSGYKHTDETKKIISKKSKTYMSTPEGRNACISGGKIAGKKNAESGKLAYARSKILNKDTFAEFRKSDKFLESASNGGKIGGKVSGKHHVESEHIQKLGKKWGKIAVESGQLQKIQSLGGKICTAKKWGYEKEPDLWISKKTGLVLYDGRNN